MKDTHEVIETSESSALVEKPNESLEVIEVSPDPLASEKSKLKTLLENRESNFWEIGDLVLDLEAKGAVISKVADEIGYEGSSLSEFKNTAAAFPKDTRKTSIPFYTYLKARYAASKSSRKARRLRSQNPSEEVAKALDAFVTPDPVAALEVITAEESKTGRKLDKRKATNLIAGAIHEKIKAVTSAPAPVQDDLILNRCHHVDCNEFLRSLVKNPPAWKPKLINLDPPYGSYKKLKDGKLDVNSSAAAMIGGNNLSAGDAVTTTVETIGLIAPFVENGTTVLLWQGSKELRQPILKAITEAGLEVEIAVIWDKVRPQPGDFTDAYNPQTELCWVIKKKGSDVVTHEHIKPRGNVLRATFEAEDGSRPFWFAQSAGSIVPTHVWKKPIGISEYFIRKHTDVGDVVWDLYGCTGTFSMAAAKLGRRFVYCESFKDNFDTFTPAILRALENAQKNEAATGTEVDQQNNLKGGNEDQSA